MPRKPTILKAVTDEDSEELTPMMDSKTDEVEKLNHMLGAVLTYLSDDEVEEIEIDYLLNNTEGLRDWWDQYRESNRKQIEEEIRQSLGELSLEELKSIREQIKDRE